MTRHQQLLAETLLGQLRDATPQEAVEKLFRMGLVNPLACERLALRAEIARLESDGMPRCEAFHVAARTFSCSYEKVRSLYYKSFKS